MSYYRHPPSRTYGGGIGLPPFTPMVRGILIACVAVWFVQFLLGPVLRIDVATLVGGRLVAPPSLQYLGLVPDRVVTGFIWQPFTYMWLHGDARHILLNLLLLWMLGGDLERHWGSRGFLRYYVVCGVGAGVFITVGGLLGEGSIPTIGASGAIYGLITAFGMIFSERVILFMMIFPMKARTFAWIMFGIAFVFSVGATGGGVSHIAHLGGAVVGYLYLKRAWRVGEFYRELRWKARRRKFKVMPPRDEDRWVN